MVTVAASGPTTVPTIFGPYWSYFSVVSGVDVDVHVRGRFREVHVLLQTTGADATGSARSGPPVPRVVGSVGRADEQIVADANDPHPHVRAHRAVGPL